MVEAVSDNFEPTGDSISSASVEAMETGDMGLIYHRSVVGCIGNERNCVPVTDDYRMQNLSERMGVDGSLSVLMEFQFWILGEMRWLWESSIHRKVL